MNPYQIIRKPLVTEKSLEQKAETNKVSFMVDVRATKYEIRQAVEAIFPVRVLHVNTMKVKGKKRRVRLQEGKRPDWKKAIVTLREGDRIEFFEGL